MEVAHCLHLTKYKRGMSVTRVQSSGSNSCCYKNKLLLNQTWIRSADLPNLARLSRGPRRGVVLVFLLLLNNINSGQQGMVGRHSSILWRVWISSVVLASVVLSSGWFYLAISSDPCSKTQLMVESLALVEIGWKVSISLVSGEVNLVDLSTWSNFNP